MIELRNSVPVWIWHAFLCNLTFKLCFVIALQNPKPTHVVIDCVKGRGGGRGDREESLHAARHCCSPADTAGLWHPAPGPPTTPWQAPLRQACTPSPPLCRNGCQCSGSGHMGSSQSLCTAQIPESIAFNDLLAHPNVASRRLNCNADCTYDFSLDVNDISCRHQAVRSIPLQACLLGPTETFFPKAL